MVLIQHQDRPSHRLCFRHFAATLLLSCIITVAYQSSILSSLASYFTDEQTNMADLHSRIFVVTTTYYPDLSDIRFNLALELCKLAKLYQIHLIITDDSPEHEDVKKQFEQAGTAEYVHVFLQDQAQYSGKGGGLRQAIQQAAKNA